MRVILITAVALFVTGLALSACDSTEDLIVGDLIINDLIVGTGPEAVDGDSLRVFYVLVREDDGRVCESLVAPADPFPFRLGSQNLIEGWNQGIEGMNEGGRREITVPPNLAYGVRGVPNNNCIRSNETLIFTVDLVEVIKD